MPAYLIRIDALDSDGAALPLFLASHDDRRVCHLDGEQWQPAIARLPALRYDLFGGDFHGAIGRPTATFAVAAEEAEGFFERTYAGARMRLWQGEPGDDFADWELRFDGKTATAPDVAAGIATFECAVDDSWLDEPLLETFEGTGGIEGPDGLEGTVKPLLLGNCRFAQATLIDAVDNVYRLSGHGAIEGVSKAYDRVASLGASTGDYADLAALLAADIANGAWATCLAEGLARFGAPPDGLVSFDAQGDNAGTGGYVRKPGAIIGRIAELAGGTTDAANLAALDSACPWNLAIDVVAQTTARDLIQRIADSVGAVAGVSWTGTLFVQPLAIGAADLVLAADGSGDLAVAEVAELRAGPPFWRLATQAEPTWTVYDPSQIATEYVLRGLWNANRVYRLDDLVETEDGTAWVYINETPSAGHVPGEEVGWWVPWTDRTGLGGPLPGQLLWDDTFDPTYWILPDEADRVAWADSRSNWAARLGFTADTDVRIVYSTALDRMPRTFPGKRLYLRITAQPSWSGLVPVEIGAETVELEDGGETVPVELFYEGDAAFPLVVAIDWLDTAGDFVSRSIIGTLDPADGEVTLYGSAQAPDWGLATVSIGYPETGTGDGWWTVFEPWLAEYEPTADVTVNIPNVPETVIQCDYTGAPKAGQVDPRYVVFRLLKGELDVTAEAEWARTLTYGALNSTIETLGDANPGRLNIYYFEASSILEIAATYEGRVYTVEHKVTMLKDGAPSSGGGGSGTAGSAYGTINGSIYGTTKDAIGDEVEVTVGSGGSVSLSASYEFSSNQVAGAQTCSVQWYKWNGSAYVAQGSASGPSSNYYPSGAVNGQGTKNLTDSGLTPGAVEKYRLYGAAGGSYIVYFAGECAAVSS